ncbi:MAG TPA: SMR family transporter [Myxococcaceae bacterium]
MSSSSGRGANHSNVGTASHQARRRAMAWGILFLAGLLEVGWAVGLKYTEGFTRLWPRG